jgi:cathepsin B
MWQQLALLLVLSVSVSVSAIDNPPAEFDLRKVHPQCTPKVKDQGQCGNDEIFAAADALAVTFCVGAGDNANHTSGPGLQELSTRYIAACMQDGCNGGVYGSVVKELSVNGTFVEGCAGPYHAGTFQCPATTLEQQCKSGENTQCCTRGNVRLFRTKSPRKLPTAGHASHVEAWRAAIASSGAIMAPADMGSSAFQFYQGGILKCGSGHQPDDGSLMIMGYGEESGQKYWLAQNSWGPSWGLSGYVKIADGSCGLGSNAPFVLTPDYIDTCGGKCASNAACAGGKGACGQCSTSGVCGN